jgi:glycosyltransferase involved in cell wall biosynthesis
MNIVFACAETQTAEAFLLDIFEELSKEHQVTLIASSTSPRIERVVSSVVVVPIQRKPSPFNDLKSLLLLYRKLRLLAPDAVHSITPKAGLLTMAAARLARVPIRRHTFTGQVWVTAHGSKRRALRALDKLTARNTTEVFADSPSQMAFLRSEKVIRSGHGSVLGDGSVAGVNELRFRPDSTRRNELRQSLGYGPDDVVFMFLGRMNVDKGLRELIQGFEAVHQKDDKVRLLFVGPDESHGLLNFPVGNPHFRMVSATPEPEGYFNAADVLVIPSYREGFGNVVIEAAACGLPAIGTRIYGLTDAIDDGKTGVLVPARDSDALAKEMLHMASDSAFRERLGAQAKQRVDDKFSSKVFRKHWAYLYTKQSLTK